MSFLVSSIYGHYYRCFITLINMLSLIPRESWLSSRRSKFTIKVNQVIGGKLICHKSSHVFLLLKQDSFHLASDYVENDAKKTKEKTLNRKNIAACKWWGDITFTFFCRTANQSWFNIRYLFLLLLGFSWLDLNLLLRDKKNLLC